MTLERNAPVVKRVAIHVSIVSIISGVIVGCVVTLFYVSTSRHHDILPTSWKKMFVNNAQREVAFIDSFGLLKSVMSPKLQWCTSNPFLVRYNQSVVLELELKWFEWSRNSLPRTYEMLKTYARQNGVNAGDIVHLAYPITLPLPCPYPRNLTRYGGESDGSKILCGAESLTPSSKCIVYSLGSSNNFNFEFDLLKNTSCEIHTYDCTSPAPGSSIERLWFHQICMGEPSQLQAFIFPYAGQIEKSEFKNASLFRPFNKILNDNNHTQVHILKMDVEGAEYSVFADLLRHPPLSSLPYQISFESHWWNRDIHHATMHQQMFAQLWKSGYRFLQHEHNPGDKTCVEWTIMRVFC